MLSLIPGRPRKITVRELLDRLKSEGFDVHARSIERDLHKLSEYFPLTKDDGRPAGWSWKDQEKQISFPRMDVGTALTYELLGRYLEPILPRELRHRLEPSFTEARRVLDQLGATPIGKWSKRIAVIPFGQQLLPPDIKPDVGATVYEALLKGLRFSADYLALGADAPRTYTFSPQGLVLRSGVLYIVANLWGYEDVRQFALHRMNRPVLLDEPALPLPGFDLSGYIRDEKAFEFPEGKTVKVHLRVDPWLGRHLQECRLASDQTVTEARSGDYFTVTATIAETQQFQWWIRSLGSAIEVVKPMALRRKIADEIKATSRVYRRH
jgi:predicted DNA-binding transcriptional regulator YafY